MFVHSTRQRRPVSFIAKGLTGGLVLGVLLYILMSMVVLIIALSGVRGFWLPGLPVIIDSTGTASVGVDPVSAGVWAVVGAVVVTLVEFWRTGRPHPMADRAR